MLSLFAEDLNQIYVNLESTKWMQSCFHQRVFFLIDPTIICSKQSSLSPLLLLIAPLCIQKAKSLLQIYSPMAREWMSWLFFIFTYSLTFSASLTNRHLMRENIGLNNVESCSESLSIRMARSLNRCGSINNVFLCNISSLSRIDHGEAFFVLIYWISAD